jgi:hypothetical protein
MELLTHYTGEEEGGHWQERMMSAFLQMLTLCGLKNNSTPNSKILLQELITAQSVKKFFTFCESRSDCRWSKNLSQSEVLCNMSHFKVKDF